jgi:hypothetical protein
MFTTDATRVLASAWWKVRRERGLLVAVMLMRPPCAGELIGRGAAGVARSAAPPVRGSHSPQSTSRAEVERVVQIEGAVALRWTPPEYSKFNPPDEVTAAHRD